jgi:hypothetical protein
MANMKQAWFETHTRAQYLDFELCYVSPKGTYGDPNTIKPATRRPLHVCSIIDPRNTILKGGQKAKKLKLKISNIHSRGKIQVDKPI